MVSARTLISPNERPILYPGESPRTLSGRLKSFSLPTPEPPLEPPTEDGRTCEDCNGAGCDACEFTGVVFPPDENPAEYEPEEDYQDF